MEKIESLNLLHRAFSVFLFNSKYELLLQVCLFCILWVKTCLSMDCHWVVKICGLTWEMTDSNILFVMTHKS